MVIYYLVVFIATVLLGIFYAFKWHKHFDVHVTLIFLITPVVNLGYLLLALSKNYEEALLANKITYIGGCYLLLMILLGILSLCKLKVSIWLRTVLLTLSSVVYGLSLTAGYSTIFYKSAEYGKVNGAGAIVNKVYGPTHVLFLIMVISYFVLSIIAVIYTYFKQKQVSRKIIFLLSLTALVGMVSFFGGKLIFENIELIPAAYVLALLMFAIIIERINLYDISETAIDSIIEKGDVGFISFDFKKNYLGSNETAKTIIPELNDFVVDKKILDNSENAKNLSSWIDEFVEDEENDKNFIDKDGKTYLVRINYLMDGKKKKGYQLLLTDDTTNQEHIKLINLFNTELQKEVETKTKHIIDMTDSFILGIATMVESRDNSTGGHINRTKEGVKMLIDEIRKDNIFHKSDEFYDDVIKSAPMHDLGKVTVDDSILRKPGKLTLEEYEKMKTHAAEGAKIISSIITDEDIYFKGIAMNVAHYHHEKYDGTGYPDGLKGDHIPLEARIMAIADYYDAIASKRAYKEKVPPKETYEQIMSEMGTHFDPKLKVYLERAKNKFEEYYNSVE